MGTLLSTTPVTLAEVKHHLRITHDLSDPEITDYLLAGIEYVENLSHRIFADRSISFVLDCFPGTETAIFLEKSPVQSIDSIAYYDADNAAQTVTVNTLILYSNTAGVARVRPAYEGEWPATAERPDAVTVTYTAGYGGASNVPQTAKWAIMLATQHAYDERAPIVKGTISSELQMSVSALCEMMQPGHYIGAS